MAIFQVLLCSSLIAAAFSLDIDILRICNLVCVDLCIEANKVGDNQPQWNILPISTRKHAEELARMTKTFDIQSAYNSKLLSTIRTLSNKRIPGRSEADIKAWFLEKAMECSQEHSVNSEEIKMMKEHKLPDSDNAKCLLACVFKKAEWIDEKGMFDENSAYKLSLKEYPNDKEKLDNSKKLFGLCKKVNEESVGDGTKGCERASLLASCLMKNAGQSGFLLQ